MLGERNREMKTICIGTRKSKLAIIQGEIVKRSLLATFPDLSVHIKTYSTKGDKHLEKPLYALGGKGVFTKELEDAIIQGEIDLAVHSAKDVPMEIPESLCICSVLEREDGRDVLVGLKERVIERDEKISIGTSSLRRALQIKSQYPNGVLCHIRGNVDTRLKKLKDGECQLLLLAGAGLRRLGYDIDKNEGEYTMTPLPRTAFLPAPGQGILAVEIRKDSPYLKYIKKISHKETEGEMIAERAFLKNLGGGCNAPTGAYAKIKGDTLFMEGFYAKKGKEKRTDSLQVKLSMDKDRFLEQVENVGKRLACKLTFGKVWIVGAGPGDRGLITQKGLHCIQNAQVIVYDHIISPSLLMEGKKDAELIYAGKKAGCHHMEQEEINRLLIEKAKEGKDVLRLKGGDPFVFGRGAEEAASLKEAGICFEIVPGVSSVYSVPAYGGIPVTDRNYSSSFLVSTGHRGVKKAKRPYSWEEETKVYLMGLGTVDQMTKKLISQGVDENTKAAIISKGTTARQKCMTGTLCSIPSLAKKEKLETPAVVVVGNIVNRREQICWFEESFLHGTKVMLTGTKYFTKKLSSLLEEKGAEAVCLGLIETQPIKSKALDEALSHMENYDYLIFTSSNGVLYFLERLKDLGIDIRSIGNVKIGAIGQGTKETLNQAGLTCPILPLEYTSASLSRKLTFLAKEKDRFLLLRAKESSSILPKTLEKAGIYYEDIPLYETFQDMRKEELLLRSMEDVDYIVFASEQAALAYKKMAGEKKTPGRFVAIGPVTARKMRELSMEVHVEAREPRAEEIVHAIVEDVLR